MHPAFLSAIIILVGTCFIQVGGFFPHTKSDGCPYGWEEADWNNSPGVKVGYWYCIKK